MAVGIVKIEVKIEECYKPTDANMDLWRSGVVGSLGACQGGAYDPKLAKSALAGQGLDLFIATLKKGGQHAPLFQS